MLTDFLLWDVNLSSPLAMILVSVDSRDWGASSDPFFIAIDPKLNVFEAILSPKVRQPPPNVFVLVSCRTYPHTSSRVRVEMLASLATIVLALF